MLLSKSGLYLTKFDVLDCLWIFIFIVLSFAKRWQAVFGSSGESNPELRPFVCRTPPPARAGKIMDISYVPIKQQIKKRPEKLRMYAPTKGNPKGKNREEKERKLEKKREKR